MVRYFRPLLLVSAAVLVTGCSLGAPSYPKFGEAAYRLEGAASTAAGAAPVQTTIYRDGQKMRIESQLPTGLASIVYDDLTGAAYIVTQAAAAAATVAAAPTATATTTPASVTTTSPAGATTTTTAALPSAPAPVAPARAVGGTAVRVADADVPKPMEAAWAALGSESARYVGPCTVAGEKGGKWTPKERTDGVSRVACITSDGIVLEIVEGQTALWQAARLERGAQDASLFGVPAGYQVIDPQAVAQSVGQTMQDLSNVAGEPAAPATSPAPAIAPKT